MKIIPGLTPKLPVVDPGKTEKPSAQRAPSSSRFEEILNENKRSTTVEESRPVTPLEEFMPITSMDKTQEEALDYAGSTLELLDHFQGVLAKGGIRLEKQLSHMEEAMLERVSGLMALRDELSPDDPLRETINRIGVKIAIEAYKIQRGDYTDG